MFGRPAGAVFQVRLGIAFGENAADRIRTLRGRAARETRQWPAGDVRLSGFHAYQRQDPARRFHDPPQNVAEEIPSQTGGTQGETLSLIHISEPTRRTP